MLRRDSMRLTRLLLHVVAFAVIVLAIETNKSASASCGDYLAGYQEMDSHQRTDFQFGKNGENTQRTPRPCTSGCERGQCQQNPLLPNPETPRVPTSKELELVWQRSANSDSENLFRWMRPRNNSIPLCPFLDVASPPPETL